MLIQSTTPVHNTALGKLAAAWPLNPTLNNANIYIIINRFLWMFDDTVFCNIIRILYHWRSRATCPFDLSMSCGHFAGIGVCHRGHRCECEYCLGWRSRLFFFLVIYTLCNRLCTINTVLWCENWINRIDIVTWAFEYCALFNACDRGSIEVQVMLFVKQRRMINDHFFFVYVR